MARVCRKPGCFTQQMACGINRRRHWQATAGGTYCIPFQKKAMERNGRSRSVNAALYRKPSDFLRVTAQGSNSPSATGQTGKESHWGEHVYREEHTVPFTQQLHWLAHKLSSSRSSYTQQTNHFTCVSQSGGLQIQKLHLQSFETVPCVHSHASSLSFSTDSITLT